MRLIRLNGTCVCALILVLQLGCAFGTREVTLRNSASSPGNGPSKARNHAVCFDSLTDAREDNTIGHVQNTYGSHTARVVAVNDVSRWVNEEIAIRLRKSGYRVERGCEGQSDALQLSGTIMKVYTTAYMNYLGEVTIEVSILQGQRELTKKRYSGHNNDRTNFAASAETFGNVLESSLQVAVSRLLHDIDSLDQRLVGAEQPEGSDTDSFGDESSDTAAGELTTPLPAKLPLPCPEESGGILVHSGRRKRQSIAPRLGKIETRLNTLYHQRWELNPTLSGAMCVEFSIDGAGRVREVAVVHDDLQDPPLEEELIAQLSQARFQILGRTDETTRVSYRLGFSTRSAKSSKRSSATAVVILSLLPLLTLLFMNTLSP